MRTLILLALLSSTAFAVEPAKETRTVPAFHGIRVETLADIDVTIGPVTRVEVSGPKDWLPRLETKVENGSLAIRTPGVRDKHMPTFKISITTPDLGAISISGMSNVHVTKLATKDLALSVEGAATCELSGKADNLAIAVAGAAQLKMQDLVANDAALEVSGLVGGALRANHALAAEVSGAVTVDVYGKPEITKAVSGTATFTLR